jgi:hypothetical protein
MGTSFDDMPIETLQDEIALQDPNKRLPETRLKWHPKLTPSGFDMFITVSTEKTDVGLVYKANEFKLIPIQISSKDLTKAIEAEEFFLTHLVVFNYLEYLKEFCQHILNSQTKIIRGN